MFEAQINIKPLSQNEAWQGRRFKTDKYKAFQRDVLFILPKTKFDFKGLLRVNLFFGFSSKASDIDNGIKQLLDILQKKYGFNDNQIYELNIRKCIVKKGSEFVTITVNNLLPF